MKRLDLELKRLEGGSVNDPFAISQIVDGDIIFLERTRHSGLWDMPRKVQNQLARV